jgi:phenylacetate-CoA ligase
MKTSLNQERKEQRLWKPVGRGAAPRVFTQLVEGEFRDPADAAAVADAQLRSMIAHAATTAPYYARLFRRLGLAPADIAGAADLPRLPVMGKDVLRRNRESLRSRQLPDGERIHGWFASSGTTGQPTQVLHTESSNRMFSYLSQRQYRWFRFDPAAPFAIIRLAGHMPPDADGRLLRDGETGRHPSWRYAGTFFETGPQFCFNVTNPVEAQLDWLAREQPAYLQSYSESLEHLAFACEGSWPAAGLRKLQAVSEQLTPSMRRRIESTTGAPVEQGYGLNEIGLVAARCAAGRYHVHAEHCIVEIVDESCQPCRAGDIGRIAVTALKNPAMPLLRYDTGDMARCVAGPCPCGRTLPSFGDLVGRYSRIAFLPEGTLQRVGALRTALEEMPAAAVRGLRQFQIHQFRDSSFEMRLLMASDLPAPLAEALAAAWREAAGGEFPLRVVRVDAIARSPGGKFQDFTSDFMPALTDKDD